MEDEERSEARNGQEELESAWERCGRRKEEQGSFKQTSQLRLFLTARDGNAGIGPG